MRQRRTKEWWTETLAALTASGLSRKAFAEREGLALSTLQLWSTKLGRATRAEHGRPEIRPIEISVEERASVGNEDVELAVDGLVLRFRVGSDIEYLAALLGRLRAR